MSTRAVLLGLAAAAVSVPRGLAFQAPLRASRRSLAPLRMAQASEVSLDALVGQEPEEPENAVRPPPGREGRFVRLTESVSYLRSPEDFVKARVEEFGPVFSTYLFFRKTVLVGGAEAVSEFMKVEPKVSESSLPDTFTELHTKYGLLNLSDEEHRVARKVALGVFSESFLQAKLPLIAGRTDELIAKLQGQEEMDVSVELKEWCLQLFSEMYLGTRLTPEAVKLFQDYNRGLLSLGKRTRSFRAGKRALQELIGGFMEQVDNARNAPADEEAFRAIRIFMDGVDTEGKAWDDERIATAVLLNVWGAYAETASSIANSLLTLQDNDFAKRGVLNEALARREQLEALDWMAFRLSYTGGALREGMRVQAPNGGGFRMTKEPISVAGYDIEAGTVVSADPRISNADANLFPEPERFEPARWVSSTYNPEPKRAGGCPFSGGALKLPTGAWFPGGIGTHACPGMATGELVGRTVLAKWTMAFNDWKLVDEDVTYEILPIKIPVDGTMISLTPRPRDE